MKINKNQQPSISITGENVIGTISASGRARIQVNQKVVHQATPEMDRLFKLVYKKIKTRPENLEFDNEQVQTQVKRIEKEAARGERADKVKLKGWIDKLAKIAPDIIDVMMASLGGPVTGFTAVFKKIVDKAKSSPTG